MNATAEHERLAAATGGLGLEVGEHEFAQLLAYRDLIAKWNRVYNLTAVTAPGHMLARHLVDSLSIAPWITDGPVLDVGSGAGLPGIPLAIAHPETDFTLLDTAAKRTRFLTQVVAELGLNNVSIVTSRIESYAPNARYPIITSRAFTALPDFVNGVARLLTPDGRVIAMKGQLHDQELAGLDNRWAVAVTALDYPGRNGDRHAVILSRPAP